MPVWLVKQLLSVLLSAPAGCKSAAAPPHYFGVCSLTCEYSGITLLPTLFLQGAISSSACAEALCRSILCRCQACLPCEGRGEVAVVAGVEGVDAAVPQGQVARWRLGTVLLPCSSRQHRLSSRQP